VQDYILTACSLRTLPPSLYTSQPAPAALASATMTRPIEYSRVRLGGMPYDLATPLTRYPQGSSEGRRGAPRGAEGRRGTSTPEKQRAGRSVLNARRDRRRAAPRRGYEGGGGGCDSHAARIIVYWCTLRGPPRALSSLPAI